MFATNVFLKNSFFKIGKSFFYTLYDHLFLQRFHETGRLCRLSRSSNVPYFWQPKEFFGSDSKLWTFYEGENSRTPSIWKLHVRGGKRALLEENRAPEFPFKTYKGFWFVIKLIALIQTNSNSKTRKSSKVYSFILKSNQSCRIEFKSWFDFFFMSWEISFKILS